MVNIGNSNCTVYIGDSEVSAIYVGTTQIYPNSGPTPPEPSGQTDYTKEYLTFKITSAGQIKWYCNNSQSTNRRTIQYSTDNGSTWTSITSNSRNMPSINVTTGDKVIFKGTNNSYMGSSSSYYSCFSGTTAGFELEGNIMSLIYGDNFSGTTEFPQDSTYNFKFMFYGCSISSVDNLVLPATALTIYCYQGMFQRCASLTKAPALPATTLVSGCYANMFSSCSSLNYIKCLATNFQGNGCTSAWVQAVASSGTFVKATGANWTTGAGGIPIRWTVIEE